MDDVNWLRSRITLNEELLWQARQFSRGLLEYRADIATLWDDSAARHVRTRFLLPHQEDAARLLECLMQQAGKLSEAMAELEQVYLSAAEADRLSADIDRFLEEAFREIRSAADSIERATTAAAQSLSSSSHAEEMVQRANSYGP